ncbi:MAG: hypothetical protein JWR35_3584 [Marmoricola sp.]|jgi:ABC-2 type transport system permease protein|nr:hypothetical protein [Marmoricola sp.]
MRNAFAYELMRIRTIRSTWWLSGLAVVVGVLISSLFALAVGLEFSRTGADDTDGLSAAVVTQLASTGVIPSLVGFLLAMIGIFAWGHEYRHGMIRASLTALNSRSSLWIAKYVVCAAWVAAVALVTMVLSGLVAMIFLQRYTNVFDTQAFGIIGRELVYVVILTWLGMAFTSVTRSQAFALVAVFLWPLLIESLIHGFFLLVPGLRDNEAVLRFLPFGAGTKLLDVFDEGHQVFGDPLSPLGGGIVFATVAVALMLASYLLFEERDA